MDTFGDAFADRYVWSGTRDRSPFLAMGDAMDFRERLGEKALVAYIHNLSHVGAALMVDVLGTASRGVGGLVAPSAMQAAMHNVIAPTTGNVTNQAMQCARISSQLQTKYRIQIYAGAVNAIPCFLRVHAQIYLELSDYKRLAEAVLEILSGDRGDGDEEEGGGGVRNLMAPNPVSVPQCTVDTLPNVSLLNQQ